MKSLTQSLAVIADIWQQDRAELVELLQPGLSRSEIQVILAQFSIQLPEELYELYEWHNGIQKEELTDFATDFLPGFDFPCIEDALLNFKHVENYRHQVISLEKEYGQRPWFPIFSIDVQHLIVFGDRQPTDVSPIYYLSTNSGERIQMIYPDLTTLASVVANCYASGAYYYETKVVDDYGHAIEFLREDSEQVAQIKRRHLIQY